VEKFALFPYCSLCHFYTMASLVDTPSYVSTFRPTSHFPTHHHTHTHTHKTTYTHARTSVQVLLYLPTVFLTYSRIWSGRLTLSYLLVTLPSIRKCKKSDGLEIYRYTDNTHDVNSSSTVATLLYWSQTKPLPAGVHLNYTDTEAKLYIMSGSETREATSSAS
jgi:hypothetical protein